MDGIDFSGLIAKAVAGLDEVRACLLVSRDGLTLGAYPQGGEERAREAWNRLSSVGDPERGFLVMSDEVWVFARRGAYACVVVGSASAKAGLLLDRMEATLRAAEEARLHAGSATSSPSIGRRPPPAMHREARPEPEPADQVLEEVAKVFRVPGETVAPEASVAPPTPPPGLPAEPPTVPLEAPPELPTMPVAEPPVIRPPSEPEPAVEFVVEPPPPAVEPRMVEETMVEPPVAAALFEPTPPPEAPRIESLEPMPGVEIMRPEPELEEPLAPQAAVVELPDVEHAAPPEPPAVPTIGFPRPAAPSAYPQDLGGSAAMQNGSAEPLTTEGSDPVPAGAAAVPGMDGEIHPQEAAPTMDTFPAFATPEPPMAPEGPRYTPPATLLGEAAFMGAGEPVPSLDATPGDADHAGPSDATAEVDAPAPTAGLHVPPETEDGDVDAAALAREFAQLFDEPNEL